MQYILNHFLGTAVNFTVVLILGILGTLIKRGLPKRCTDAIMSAIGICVVYIGIDGVLEQAPDVPDGSLISAGMFKVLIMILSMVFGTLIGELIDFDRWITRLGDYLGARLGSRDKGDFTRGFISCSLLFCVGALTVNGAIADAQGDPSLLFAKSIIDGVSVFIMAGTLGVGCVFSAFFILVYQGAVTLGAVFLVDALSASTLTYMSVTGSLLIILLGLNVLGLTKVKTANMIPAMFLPIAFEALLKLIL